LGDVDEDEEPPHPTVAARKASSRNAGKLILRRRRNGISIRKMPANKIVADKVPANKVGPLPGCDVPGLDPGFGANLAAEEPGPTVKMVTVAFGLPGVTVVGLIEQVSPATPDCGVQVRFTVPVKAGTASRTMAAVPWSPGRARVTRLGFTEKE
jgi:hypothetical protein